MRAPVRIRALTQEEYSHLKRMRCSRKLAADRAKRAQIILLCEKGRRSGLWPLFPMQTATETGPLSRCWMIFQRQSSN